MNAYLKRNLKQVLQGVADVQGAVAALSNAALQTFDQVNSDPGFSVLVLAWAAARLAHKSGVSWLEFTELIRVAWAYSEEYDKKEQLADVRR